MDDKLISQAVRDTIARDILKGISQDDRDAIIARSITAALGDYDFKRAIEKTVTAEAEKTALKLLATHEWSQKIAAAVRGAVNNVLAILPDAVEATFIEALAGKPGDTYNRQPGALLEHLRKRMPKETDK